ncbi:MAG: hypothetical protein R3F56_19505 [Planctomycetota bacterium]
MTDIRARVSSPPESTNGESTMSRTSRRSMVCALVTLGTLAPVVRTQTVAAAPPSRPLHDVFVAVPGASPDEFIVQWWTSVGSVGSFSPQRPVAFGYGRVCAIVRDDRGGGDLFVAATMPAGSSQSSVIYSFVSPFIRTVRQNYLPPRVRYGTPPPEVITDFEYEPPNPSNANRSTSLVVVGRNTSNGTNWLRRVPLAGGTASEVSWPAGAQRPRLAIDPAGGDIFVVDEQGWMRQFGWSLNQLGVARSEPRVAFSDVIWDHTPARRDALVASGTYGTATTGGMFRLTPGVAAAVQVSVLPTAIIGANVDADGDGYCLATAGRNRAELWFWDNASGALLPTSMPVADYQAMAWAGRCSVETIARTPGTPVLSRVAPPFVGDPGLAYTLQVPNGVVLGPTALLFATDWIENGPFLAPSAQLVVDPAGVVATLPVAARAPSSVFVPLPLRPYADGTRLVTQFVSLDLASNRLLASSASNFAVGRRPVD